MYQRRHSRLIICYCFFLLSVPLPEVTDSSANVSIAYRDNVTIFCTAMSFRNDASITWSTTAGIMLPSTTTDSLANDQYKSSLTLTDVGLEATGVYTCTVQNSFGNDNENIAVNVEGL